MDTFDSLDMWCHSWKIDMTWTHALRAHMCGNKWRRVEINAINHNHHRLYQHISKWVEWCPLIEILKHYHGNRSKHFLTQQAQQANTTVTNMHSHKMFFLVFISLKPLCRVCWYAELAFLVRTRPVGQTALMCSLIRGFSIFNIVISSSDLYAYTLINK